MYCAVCGDPAPIAVTTSLHVNHVWLCEDCYDGLQPEQARWVEDPTKESKMNKILTADAQAAAHLWRAAADAAVALRPDVVRIDQGSMLLAYATGMDLEDAQRCLILVLRQGADLPPGEVKVYRSANAVSEWRYVQYSPGLWVESYVPDGAKS